MSLSLRFITIGTLSKMVLHPFFFTLLIKRVVFGRCHKRLTNDSKWLLDMFSTKFNACGFDIILDFTDIIQ